MNKTLRNNWRNVCVGARDSYRAVVVTRSQEVRQLIELLDQVDRLEALVSDLRAEKTCRCNKTSDASVIADKLYRLSERIEKLAFLASGMVAEADRLSERIEKLAFLASGMVAEADDIVAKENS